ncbi:hypothetical protein IT575_11525 [bacterium]|nr:hypothetical protein [bacterium]
MSRNSLYSAALAAAVALCAVSGLLARPVHAEEAAAPAEAVSVPDTSAYQRVEMDVNGYENFTLGQPVSTFLNEQELLDYKSTDSDGVFNFYDMKMVDESAALEYFISIGTYFAGGSELVGSVEMRMDVGFGDATFYHIKKQLEDSGSIVLNTTPDDSVPGGLHMNMEDADGDTFELSWTPVNTAGKTSGTSVFVSSSAYFLALIDSALSEGADSTAGSSEGGATSGAGGFSGS